MLALLAFILVCRCSPQAGEFYARQIYPAVNAVQTVLYDAFLKGKRISDGTRNYSQVISLILSLEDIESHSRCF